jgi:hypothetical protein
MSWVFFEHSPHEVDRILAGCVFILDVGIDDHSIQIFHLVSFEGHIPIEHRIQTDPSTPNVHWKPYVADFSHDLGRHIGWGPALVEKELISILDLSAYTEVANFDSPLAVK